MRFSAAFYELIFTQKGLTVDQIAAKYHVSKDEIENDLISLGLYNPNSTDSVAEHEREYDHTLIGTGGSTNVSGVPNNFIRIKVGGGIEDSGKTAVDFETAGAAAAVMAGHEAAHTHPDINAGDGAIAAGDNSVTITHNLDHVPKFIGITPLTGLDSPYEVDNRTTTQFDLIYKGGVTQAPGTTGNFTWVCLYW